MTTSSLANPPGVHPGHGFFRHAGNVRVDAVREAGAGVGLDLEGALGHDEVLPQIIDDPLAGADLAVGQPGARPSGQGQVSVDFHVDVFVAVPGVLPRVKPDVPGRFAPEVPPKPGARHPVKSALGGGVSELGIVQRHVGRDHVASLGTGRVKDEDRFPPGNTLQGFLKNGQPAEHGSRRHGQLGDFHLHAPVAQGFQPEVVHGGRVARKEDVAPQDRPARADPGGAGLHHQPVVHEQ